MPNLGDRTPIELDVHDLDVTYEGKSVGGFEGDTMRLICCDCGLTHGFGVLRDKVTGEMKLMFERNSRSTAQYRRSGNAKLIDGNGKWVMRRR